MISSQTKFIAEVLESYNLNPNLNQLCYKSIPSRPKNCVNQSDIYLVKDVFVWDPLSLDESFTLNCPSCNVNNPLHPIRWIDGSKEYERPRTLYGLHEDAYLVSRVYMCQNKHQIIAHDPSIISQAIDLINPPFVLFHKCGVTKELYDYFISHSNTELDIKAIQILWAQTQLDYYCQTKSKFILHCKYYEKINKGESLTYNFPTFSEKGVQTGIRIIKSCIIFSYNKNLTLYNSRMSQTTAISWISADHTYKVSANVGFWRNGKWFKIYDTLFIVLNEDGVVNAWQLSKGTKFLKISNLLEKLMNRLSTQGNTPSIFFVDNCCQWRNLIQQIFPFIKVKLDIFHAIQRIIQCIPKYSGTNEIKILRKTMINALRLVIRDPTDIGAVRTKETPNSDVIQNNINSFVKHWGEIEYEGQLILPEKAIIALNKLRKHVENNCLSNIPVSGGTNRNESLHKLLNKTLKRSRLGIHAANAILGLFFYKWNERKISTFTSSSMITYPIEFYAGITQSNETFGIASSVLSENICEESENIFSLLSQKTTEENLSNLSESDNEEQVEADEDKLFSAFLEKDIFIKIIQTVKLIGTVNEICGTDLIRNKYFVYLPASLCLLTVNDNGEEENATLETYQTAFGFKSSTLLKKGTCFINAVLEGLGSILNLIESTEALDWYCKVGLSFTNISDDILRLKELVVEHWLSNEAAYSAFVHDMNFIQQVNDIQKNDCFEGPLACSLPLAVAGILRFNLVVLTGMKIIPLVPITVHNPLFESPIWFSYANGSFSYLVAPIKTVSVEPPPQSSSLELTQPQKLYCRCGCGSKKNSKDAEFCNTFKGRCPCYQNLRKCNEQCKCRNCCNTYGRRLSNPSIPTAKRCRRSTVISTKTEPGVILIPANDVPLLKWSLFEEIFLIEIIKLLSEIGISECDFTMLHDKFNELRVYIMEKEHDYNIVERTPNEISKKAKEIYACDNVFRKLITEQARLCV